MRNELNKYFEFESLRKKYKLLFIIYRYNFTASDFQIMMYLIYFLI